MPLLYVLNAVLQFGESEKAHTHCSGRYTHAALCRPESIEEKLIFIVLFTKYSCVSLKRECQDSEVVSCKVV